MLLRHSLIYAAARGLPGIINFIAIGIFTHPLDPASYGQYALIVAIGTLGSAVLFQWMRLGLLRFLPLHQQQPGPFLSTIAAGFAAMIACTAIFGVFTISVWPDTTVRPLIFTVLLLIWAQAWFDLNLELLRTQLSPVRYGALSLARALLTLGFGFSLVRLNYGYTGLVSGMIAGTLLPALLLGAREWWGVRPALVDWPIFKQLLTYGMPLTLTAALGFIVSTSDRLLLGWLEGAEAAGVYAVGYDLAQQTLGMLMMIVNLAAYPLVVRALTERGEEAARSQLDRNGSLLLAVAVPATLGLAILAPQITEVLLGESFEGAAEHLIPWIAVGAFLAGLKAYHFDLSFQLGQKTVDQVKVVLFAALLNILLNMWWIPHFGYMASAYSTVITYAVALLLSWRLGKQSFVVPLPLQNWISIVLGAGALSLTLILLSDWSGIIGIIMKLIMSVITYFSVFMLTNSTYRIRFIGHVGRILHLRET